jgi:hypothetical protein
MAERTDEPANDAEDPVAVGPAGAGLAATDDCRHVDEETHEGLPVRSASEVSLRRNIRRMDDPEVLERVLAGLLDLG